MSRRSNLTAKEEVAPFRVVTDMVPAGDQPTAIAEIDKRMRAGD